MENKNTDEDFGKVERKKDKMKLVDLIFKKKNKQRLTKNSNSKYPACTLNDIVNETHPKLTPITQEEVDDIHARGKITQEEKIKEWEKLDLCAPGDNIGSSSWRCRKYHYDCHDCLVAYSSKKRSSILH